MYLLKSHGKVKIIYIGKLSLHSLFSQANRMQIADMNYDTCSVPSAYKILDTLQPQYGKCQLGKSNILVNRLRIFIMKIFICTTDTVEYDYEVANATFHNKLLLLLCLSVHF